MSDRRIKAVLLDVGQPLVEDSALEEYWNPWLADYLSKHFNRTITVEKVREKQAEGIECYAPSIYSFVIWQYVKPDKKLYKSLRHELDSLDYSKFLFVRPEAVEICRELSEKYTLAIAANQPPMTAQILDDAGLLQYFKFRSMSGEMAHSKPDLRFFTHILDSIGMSASDAVMVGDRQDNDITPAKMLGMRALRWKGGFFKDQIVRLPREEPDGELTSLHELPGLLEKLQAN